MWVDKLRWLALLAVLVAVPEHQGLQAIRERRNASPSHLNSVMKDQGQCGDAGASTPRGASRHASASPQLVPPRDPVRRPLGTVPLGVWDVARKFEGAAGAEVARAVGRRQPHLAALQAAIDRIAVYARVHPAQKLRIVEVLQSHGDVVAMKAAA